jgi:hypothetical protein
MAVTARRTAVMTERRGPGGGDGREDGAVLERRDDSRAALTWRP